MSLTSSLLESRRALWVKWPTFGFRRSHREQKLAAHHQIALSKQHISGHMLALGIRVARFDPSRSRTPEKFFVWRIGSFTQHLYIQFHYAKKCRHTSRPSNENYAAFRRVKLHNWTDTTHCCSVKSSALFLIERSSFPVVTHSYSNGTGRMQRKRMQLHIMPMKRSSSFLVGCMRMCYLFPV